MLRGLVFGLIRPGCLENVLRSFKLPLRTLLFTAVCPAGIGVGVPNQSLSESTHITYRLRTLDCQKFPYGLLYYFGRTKKSGLPARSYQRGKKGEDHKRGSHSSVFESGTVYRSKKPKVCARNPCSTECQEHLEMR